MAEETDEPVETGKSETDESETDESETVETAASPEDWERPIDRFRRGAVGSVIAAGLFGVRDALEGRPEREEPQIIADAPEPKLDHIDLVLDPQHPERSRAIVYLPPRDEPSD